MVDVLVSARRSYAGRNVYVEAKTPHRPWVVVAHARLNRMSIGRFRVDKIAATSRLRAFLPRARTNPVRVSNEIVAYPPSCLKEIFVVALRRHGLRMEPAPGAGLERWGIVADVYRNENGELHIYEFPTDSEAARAARSIGEPSSVWLLWGPLLVFSVGSNARLEAIQDWARATVPSLYADWFACYPTEGAQGTAVCLVHAVQLDGRPASGVTVCFLADFNASAVEFFGGRIDRIDASDAIQVRGSGDFRGRVCLRTGVSGNAAVRILNSNPTLVDVSALLPDEGLARSIKLQFPIIQTVGPLTFRDETERA